MGDVWRDGVVGLLDIGVTLTDPLFRLICFLAVWCQFRSAVATLSLNMVGFIDEPICVTRA